MIVAAALLFALSVLVYALSLFGFNLFVGLYEMAATLTRHVKRAARTLEIAQYWFKIHTTASNFPPPPPIERICAMFEPEVAMAAGFDHSVK